MRPAITIQSAASKYGVGDEIILSAALEGRDNGPRLAGFDGEVYWVRDDGDLVAWVEFQKETAS